MSDATEAGFALDPRLAHDTVFVVDAALCRVLLMDDARFPWLILVPRRVELTELDALGATDSAQLAREVHGAMRAIRTVAPCDKLNVGALGNVVRQLHVHVVARREGDAAWPGPVWGSGATQPYAPDARHALVARLRAALART